MQTPRLQDKETPVGWLFENCHFDLSEFHQCVLLARVYDKELACRLEDAVLGTTLDAMEHAFTLGYKVGRNPDLMLFDREPEPDQEPEPDPGNGCHYGLG